MGAERISSNEFDADPVTALVFNSREDELVLVQLFRILETFSGVATIHFVTPWMWEYCGRRGDHHCGSGKRYCLQVFVALQAFVILLQAFSSFAKSGHVACHGNMVVDIGGMKVKRNGC